jgi:hypothetical protein
MRTRWLTGKIGWTPLAGLMLLAALAGASMAAEPASETVALFNGKDLSGWKGLSPSNEWLAASAVKLDKKDPKKFEIEPGEGILVNGAKGNTANIVSEYEFGDCQLHIEFTVPQGSNSGVYFQGLYEIQVFDSFGKKDKELTFSDCGGIYARYNEKTDKTYEGQAPGKNASKAPGEWQSFDAIFRAPRFDASGKKTENARFISVKHNGEIVHENYEVTGGTRACMNRPESPKGPLMLQGDHGPVSYRNIQLIPLKLK